MAASPRILVIRGGAIGDFVLTLPALKLLREAFPKAHIEILGYQHIVQLAAGRYYANAVRSIEYGPMAGFFVPGGNLDPALAEYFGSFHQVISFLFDPEQIFEANLRRCGVKNFLSGPSKINDSDHAARQLALPLESLALYLDDHAATLYPSAADRAQGARFLKDLPLPVIAVHPGSGSPRKNWPLNQWRELVAWLTAAGRGVLLVGGEADSAQLDAIGRDPSPLVRQVRNQPLPLLAGLLAQCAAFIGHDSGISHVAAAVGIPCVLLFGPTDPAIWAPANRLVRTIRGAAGRVDAITQQQVRSAVEAIPGLNSR